MVTEDYVSFETAKLLKEKGFDEDIDLWYDENGEMFFRYKYDINSDWRVRAQQEVYLSPTIQMVEKWIRKKGFHIFVPMEIDYDEDENGDKRYYEAYYPEIRRISDGITYVNGCLYASPEQACEAGIKYCLENLI